MAYKILLKNSAQKELKKLDKNNYTRVRTAIDKLATNPRPNQAIKLIGSTGLWRLRVSNYRVIYEIQDNKLVVMVIRVAHRREVYKK